MKALWGIVVLAFAVPAWAGEADGGDWRYHRDQAEMYLRMLDYRRAIDEYREAYKADPRRVWLLFNIARAHHRLAGTEPDFTLRRGYLQRSLEGFEFFLAVDPKAPERADVLAEMEEIRKDLARVDADEQRAAERREEQAAERERERKRMQELEAQRERAAAERRASDERSKALAEQLKRVEEQLAATRRQQERQRATRRLQVRLGVPVLAVGVAGTLAGLGSLARSVVLGNRLQLSPNPAVDIRGLGELQTLSGSTKLI